MLGVWKPITPIEYALMSDWPMSSPQMMTMFGFFDCGGWACAGLGAINSPLATTTPSTASSPARRFLATL